MWGFFLYNYKVLICGDREGLGRDTQGFLRGVFARISLITGVSQLSWGKLLFMKRHFCLHLLVQSPLIGAAEEWPDSAGRNAPGSTEEEGVWFTHVSTGIGTICLQLTWPGETVSDPAADTTLPGHLWKVTSCSLGPVSKIMNRGTFCA